LLQTSSDLASNFKERGEKLKERGEKLKERGDLAKDRMEDEWEKAWKKFASRRDKDK
jgi:gas vesicle protein